ncbi:hypothetical protein JCM10213_008514 [Rhodosporidiobolus nylandii]
MRLIAFLGAFAALLAVATAAPLVERQLRDILEVSLAAPPVVYLPTPFVDCSYQLHLSGRQRNPRIRLAVVSADARRLPLDNQTVLADLGTGTSWGEYRWTPDMAPGQRFCIRAQAEGADWVRWSAEYWAEEGFRGAEGCWERHPPWYRTPEFYSSCKTVANWVGIVVFIVLCIGLLAAGAAADERRDAERAAAAAAAATEQVQLIEMEVEVGADEQRAGEDVQEDEPLLPRYEQVAAQA